MHHRSRPRAALTLTIAGALAASLALSGPAVFAQGGASAIPRMPDGKPDLSGTYDVATLTPMSRPDRFGDKLTLTEEEAAAIVKRQQDWYEKSNQSSDADREAPPEGGVESRFGAAAGEVGGYNAFWTDLGDSTFKIDGQYRTSIIVDPPNGQRPELSAEGKARAGARQAFRRKNTGKAWWIDMESGPYDDPEVRPLGDRCLLGFGSTAGPPALPVMYNNLKRIVQTDDYVMILNEMNHDARIIRIDDEHDPAELRKWLGDSVGHWEGDTLVVDTVHFNDTPALSLATRDLHVIERFTRTDANTLLYRFTVRDPATWEEEWSGEYPWPATDTRVYEYACHEGNYAMGGILRGARLLEEEALAEKAGKPDSDD